MNSPENQRSQRDEILDADREAELEEQHSKSYASGYKDGWRDGRLELNNPPSATLTKPSEASEDGKRLDWLQADHKRARFDDSKKTFTVYFDIPTVTMHTLREAIDAARSATGRKEEQK